MTEALESGRLSLDGDGQIFWQEDVSNPLPGTPMAKIKKGTAVLAPAVELQGTKESAAVLDFVQSWLKTHIAEVLEPLIALENPEELEGPVLEIAKAVYGAMGIVSREDVDTLTENLDADQRKVLREKQIRLGPLLVFMPALNKPAAVRLRGLLWCLWHDKALPAPVPNDGIVSQRVEDADPDFYRAIGYPVFGPRACRIDMLDRVICAVYDSADKGQFKAQHQMAEWLGCPIDDLYQVLEAMGHKKIEEGKEKAEGDEGKPELATFRLKKGKAFAKEQPKAAAKPKGKKKPPPKKKKSNEPRAYVAEAKTVEDSPFAVLGQFKSKSD